MTDTNAEEQAPLTRSESHTNPVGNDTEQITQVGWRDDANAEPKTTPSQARTDRAEIAQRIIDRNRH